MGRVKIIIVIKIVLILIIALSPPVQSTDLDMDIVDQKVKELDLRSNFERAVRAAKQAIEVAEANVGPDHPYVANCLSKLSGLYHAMGKEEKASEVDKEIERIQSLTP